MRRSFIGLAILLVVAGLAIGLSKFDLAGLTRQMDRPDPVNLSILYGGEKSALLANPAVRQIIEGRYRITLDAARAGSVEMVTTLDVAGRDCLWPSNSVALELARGSGKKVLGDTNIFNSPIVFFAWAEVADALAAKGVVTQRGDGLLTADIAKAGALIDSGARWKEDLGLNIYGVFRVISTHPARSNSGNIWAGLLATVLNGGTVPTEAALGALLPRLVSYFEGMGYMETSSGDIFENFLKQGMGARPIIVGYENQLVEFLIANAQYADLIKDRIRVIYPEPTVFASHPLLELTPACARLAEALQDPELQALAWAQHGFRTGLIGVENNPADIAVTTLPATVDLVVPMPTARVMERIIAAIP